MIKRRLNVKYTRIAELRLDNDLKQKDVALKLNVKENNYSKWERNITDIPLEKGNELANIYNCSLDYLFGLSVNRGNIERINIDYELLTIRLLELRKQKRLTQKEIAEEIGFQQRAYAYYESGDRKPTCFKLLYIAIYYSVSLDYLSGRSDIKSIK